MVTGEVLGEQYEMVAGKILAPAMVVTAVACHIHLRTEYGFYALFVRHLVKQLHSEHIAMVGNGECRLSQLLGATYYILYVGSAVKDGVLGMYV